MRVHIGRPYGRLHDKGNDDILRRLSSPQDVNSPVRTGLKAVRDRDVA